MNMRPSFTEIVDGWMLISGTDDLDDRIERAAKFIKENGPLWPDEKSTIGLMIECSIARHMFPRGDSEFDREYEE